MKKSLITAFGLLFLFSCQQDEDLLNEVILQNKTEISNTIEKSNLNITDISFNSEVTSQRTTTNNTLLIMFKPNVLFMEKTMLRNFLSSQLKIEITSHITCSNNFNAEYITFLDVHFEDQDKDGDGDKLPITDDPYDEEDTIKDPEITEITYAQLANAISLYNGDIVEYFSIIEDCSDVEEGDNDPSNDDMISPF